MRVGNCIASNFCDVFMCLSERYSPLRIAFLSALLSVKLLMEIHFAVIPLC